METKIKIHNYMEDVVEDAYDAFAQANKEFCGCEKCRLDVIARTLNRLPAKYVVTSKGAMYTKLDSLGMQSRTDVDKELARAVKAVSKNPKH